ncbi:rab11 family-interacting protein 5 [Amblyraja radiata]|uniref:rab11 family-interacting protein 5 n=1 Tax=Amblyraja radiata TaxID=386614 RepID=UPI001401BBC5|nr:rab11 family-interacting protein 5 [Amblyraja radiata]
MGEKQADRVPTAVSSSQSAAFNLSLSRRRRLMSDLIEIWYKLSSKPGKKEKERGEIQVSVQFVRNNLTASMFDLSSKEKHRSPLAKLRDKVKGKKKHQWPAGDSASAIVPSSVGQLTSDDDLSEKGAPEKRSKKGFFSRHKLHRSSLTKSNSSLSSQHSARSMESADSNTAVAGQLSPNMPTSPRLAYPPMPVPSTNPSLAKLLTHKRALSDEVNQVLEVHPSHLALKTSAISRSLLCINGSHVYREEPSAKSAGGLSPMPAPVCHAHHHVGCKAEAPGASAEGRQRPDEPEVRVVPPAITVNAGVVAGPSSDGQGQETETVTVTETVGGGQGAKPVHAAVPILSTADPPRAQPPAEDRKASVFPFGSDPETRPPRTPSPVRKSSSLAERSKASGWFLKDNHHKPSPHPVKPITAAALGVTEKRSARSHLSNTLTSGLEKLKSVTTGHISPMRSPVSGREEQEAVKESKLADPVQHYYHLTHDELIKKILQHESQIQKTEEHVRDLEEYIDLLLVHIMEQNPSILQTVSEKMKDKTATK